MPQTEDQVRQQANQILNFTNTKNVIAGVGQLTSFNTLGKSLPDQPWSGINDKPDGWYLPKNHNQPAIILETKASNKDLEGHPTEELKKNLNIALQYYNQVLGILYNGQQTKYIQNNQPGDHKLIDVQLATQLQNKDYYLKYFTDKPIDVHEIYNLTKRINDSLKFDFGINDLYDRMIFTACALVAQRYNANLKPDYDFSLMRTAIIDTLSKSLSQSIQQNSKLNLLVDTYSRIKANYPENKQAVSEFIKNIIKISKSINSAHWNGEDVMAIFFAEFNRYKSKSDNGQVFTPEHIANFMFRLININQDDCIFDGTCGSGTFLVKSMAKMMEMSGGQSTVKAKEIKKHQLYGIEMDSKIFSLCCANELIHKDGRTNLDCANTMSDEAKDWIHNLNFTDTENLKKYHITKILMNPPFERKYKPVDIMNAVLDNMPTGIDAAFILPDHKLEKEGKRKVQHLLTHNRLTTIIKLPEKTFREGVSVSIFLFKTGETTQGHEIFTCQIKEDGLESVKNQGRMDIHKKWPQIEDFWIKTIHHFDTTADKSCQWITPDIKNQENLSFPIPEKPFEISDKDFYKTVLNYEMFKNNIDAKDLANNLTDKVLYQGTVKDDDKNIWIGLKKKAGDK